MRPFRLFIQLFRNLLGKDRAERQLSSELDSHLEMLIDEKLRAGMSPEEALRAARIEMGGVEQVKEAVRDIRAGAWIDSFQQDLRYAVRTLRKSPGFTVIAVLTLALGIGANTAMFSVVNAVLLRPLPYESPNELIEIGTLDRALPWPGHCPIPDSTYIGAKSKTLSVIAPINASAGATVIGGISPERIAPVRVSPEFFAGLRIRPLAGRSLLFSDTQANAPAVALVSLAYWRHSFDSDPHILGRRLSIDGVLHTIVGVVPNLPDLGRDVDLLVPLVLTADLRTVRYGAEEAIARIAPGRTLKEVQAELDTLGAQFSQAHPEIEGGVRYVAMPLKEQAIGSARPPLLLLFGAVGLVLLIACANIGNMMLARGWARRPEFAIRATLGATRGRMVRQLFTESTLIALIGGVCGLLLAKWGVDGLKILLPSDTPRLENLRIDSWALIFTLLASVVAGMAFAIFPSLLISRRDPRGAVQEAGTGSGARIASVGGNRMRRALVVSEIALAMILVVGAGLAMRSLSRLLSVDLGFRTDHLLSMSLVDPQNNGQANGPGLVPQLIERMQAVPGVTAVAADLDLPIPVDSKQVALGRGGRSAQCQRVTRGYFRTLGIQQIAGREFAEEDLRVDPPVAIVNKEFVREYIDGNPIGQRIIANVDEKRKPIYGQIIGVVESVRRDPGGSPNADVYVLGKSEDFKLGAGLFVRTAIEPNALIKTMREQVWALAKDQPITQLESVDQIFYELTSAPRSRSTLLGAFAGLGLLLAMLGIYGVISYAVAQRTHEIGVRMALGAGREDVLFQMMREGIVLAGAGIAAGVAGALALTRFMTSLLFEIKPADPATYLGVACLLLSVALAACYVPARRAMSVDPMVALRYE
jgi:putative ABC transport system permease protein